MLMVTTTVGMVHWVHSHTTYTGPAVTLHLEFVVGSTGFQQGFVNTATSSNDTCNYNNKEGLCQHPQITEKTILKIDTLLFFFFFLKLHTLELDISKLYVWEEGQKNVIILQYSLSTPNIPHWLCFKMCHQNSKF